MARAIALGVVALASAAGGLILGLTLGKGGAAPSEAAEAPATSRLETAVADRDRELGAARREISELRARLEGVEKPEATEPARETLAREAAADRDPEERDEARTLESILADLRGRDPRARWIAIRDLDDLSPEDRAQALEAVRAMLAEEDKSGTQFAALEALLKLAPDEAAPLLAQYAADPESPEFLRSRAVDALAARNDSAAAAAIQKAYETGLKGPAARALQKMGDDSLAQAWADELARDLSNPDSAQRARAIASMGSLKLPSSLARITEGADDPNSNVRQSVASALGNLGDAAALPALRKLADDPVESVKRAAKFSIGRIEHPERNDRRFGGGDWMMGGDWAPPGGSAGRGSAGGRRR